MGHFGFAVNLILSTGKWIKLFTETVLPFSLRFQHKGLNRQENEVQHSKEHGIFGLETTLRFYI
jgi:hypothetical protein